ARRARGVLGAPASARARRAVRVGSGGHAGAGRLRSPRGASAAARAAPRARLRPCPPAGGAAPGPRRDPRVLRGRARAARTRRLTRATMSTMREIQPGVFHYSAMHERIKIVVSSYYLSDKQVLIDPMLPDEGL